MMMQLRIEGQPITLAELRHLVDQTKDWPAESPVEPRGSRMDQASITVAKADTNGQAPAPWPADALGGEVRRG